MAEAVLRIRPKQECRWDVLSLGEVMLRFDPGEQRIVQTRQFAVWEGGGEYNVARGLSRCFGQQAGGEPDAAGRRGCIACVVARG